MRLWGSYPAEVTYRCQCGRRCAGFRPQLLISMESDPREVDEREICEGSTRRYAQIRSRSPQRQELRAMELTKKNSRAG